MSACWHLSWAFLRSLEWFFTGLTSLQRLYTSGTDSIECTIWNWRSITILDLQQLNIMEARLGQMNFTLDLSEQVPESRNYESEWANACNNRNLLLYQVDDEGIPLICPTTVLGQLEVYASVTTTDEASLIVQGMYASNFKLDKTRFEDDKRPSFCT